jgi:hypothetical protein
MEVYAEVIFCSLDDKPIDQSIAYSLLLLNGAKVAKTFTYTMNIPVIVRGENDRIICLDMGAQK